MISIEYLAGFFDGEGHIGVITTTKDCYKLHMTLTNTNELILQSIKAEYGGRLYRIKRNKLRCKDSFSLVWSGTEAKEIIRLIIPYSKVKLSQLNLALQFPIGTNIKGMKTGKLHDKTIQIQIYSRLKQLNHRGIGK
jgi:hypothetical protein